MNIHIITHYFANNPSKKEISNSTRLSFYSDYFYNISGQNYTLNDIEHGILRANDNFGVSLFKTVWKVLWSSPFSDKSTPRFSKKDPRHRFVVDEVNPKVHFALNCGAKSCPPIRVYEKDSIHE